MSRLEHPCAPRLLDQGMLRLLTNTQHPWLVMEWLDGVPLYEWAQRHEPAHQEVCRVLAQIARVLEVLHAGGAVHRDVKGDNVLIRQSDGHPFLIDYGSAHMQGEERLTWQSLPPLTRAYLSPQAALFESSLILQPHGYYFPAPADDLFALGVTAYRLVMGQYPPALKRKQDEEGHWRVECGALKPLLERQPRVEPQMREWLLRLLAYVPEERGSAARFAQAMEAEVAKPRKAPERDRAPAVEAPPPALPAGRNKTEGPGRARSLKSARALKPWLAVAATVVVALVLWGRSRLPLRSAPEQAQAQASNEGAAVENESATATTPSSESSPSQERQGSETTPPTPDSTLNRRQARPNAKGQCPLSRHVSFNGLCWAEQAKMPDEECMKSGYTALKGKCYAPVLELPQKTTPTSAPGKAR